MKEKFIKFLSFFCTILICVLFIGSMVSADNESCETVYNIENYYASDSDSGEEVYGGLVEPNNPIFTNGLRIGLDSDQVISSTGSITIPSGETLTLTSGNLILTSGNLTVSDGVFADTFSNVVSSSTITDMATYVHMSDGTGGIDGIGIGLVFNAEANDGIATTTFRINTLLADTATSSINSTANFIQNLAGVQTTVMSLTDGVLAVAGNATVGGTLGVTGSTTIASYVETHTAIAQSGATSTVVLTGLTSGQTYILSDKGTVVALPDVTTAGINYRFQVGGDMATSDMQIVSAEGDNIEGTLMVAGAVVDCDAEDQINFIVDGENIGDYFEIMSDGTQWLLGGSGALSGSKLTCTDPA